MTTSSISIDLTHPTTPFPHYWEQVAASSEANTALYSSWRDSLKHLREKTGAREVRFHAIFLDCLGIYAETPAGEVKCNFYLLDSIYDYIVSLGMKPFIELSFMPQALRSSEKTVFFYKGYVSLPNDEAKYSEMIRQFAAHLVDRYGESEVKTWKFEVWNEPNLGGFTLGGMEQYFHLYQLTAEAVRKAHPGLLVGGPSTARCAWIKEFIDYCYKHSMPLDFITTHLYEEDKNIGSTATWVEGTEAEKKFNVVPDYIQSAIAGNFCKESFAAVLKIVRQSSLPNLQVYFTEFGPFWKANAVERDNEFNASFMCQSIYDGEGLVDGLAHWTFSDDFAERGIEPGEFTGNFGLITRRGLYKPAFNALHALHLLGDQKLKLETELPCYATRNSTGEIALLLWNHPQIETDTIELDVTIRGFDRPVTISHYRIDSDHSNSYRQWQKMGAPLSPTPDEIATLKQQMGLEKLEKDTHFTGKEWREKIAMPAHSVSLLLFSPQSE